MPTLEQIRDSRIQELVKWGKENKVMSSRYPFDLLQKHAIKLWPSRLRKTLNSYSKSAMLILEAEFSH